MNLDWSMCYSAVYQVALVVNNPPANTGRCCRQEFASWVGKISWRRAWQPTLVFLPGESHGQWWDCLVKVKVTQLCSTLCDPMDYIVHGILQVRILEWVAYPFSRGSALPRNRTGVSCITGGFFASWTIREAPVCCLGVSNSSLIWGPFLGDHLGSNFSAIILYLELKHNLMEDM